MTLDNYDISILELLSENARLTYAEIGRIIALSQSATKERVLNLMDSGVIKKYSVEIDYGKLGYSLKAIISLKFKNDEFRRFIDDVHKFPEILHCKRVTGEYCLVADCVLRDSSHLENVIDRLIEYGIPSTAIQLSEVKSGGICRDLKV